MKTLFSNKINSFLTIVLALTLVLSTGAMAAPAYAAEVNTQKTYTMEYGVSLEQAVENIKNTVDYIKANLKNGSLVDTALIDLSNQLYSLDSAIQAKGGTVSNDVKTLLGDVETTLNKVSSKNANQAKIALAVVMANTGVDSVTVQQAQANANGTNTASISFTDVSPDAWYYQYVMGCAQKGLVSGVGNNQFAPNKTMTRSEFLTVVVRYLYNNDVKNYSGDTSTWWKPYYNIAIQKGLIKTTEFTEADMGVAMNRQEMALVISRALAELGQTPDKIVSSSKIPDYSSIGSYYKDAVRVTYTAGIISGTDTSGTFSPMGTLTRGQACTVLYRLTETSTRSPQTGTEDNNSDSSSGHTNDDGTVTIGSGDRYGHNSEYDDTRFEQSATHQEWVEGQTHNKPQVGDVVIKADGTRVTLEATQIGGAMVLGWGANGPQGVDPYTGTIFGTGTLKVGSLAWWDTSKLVKDSETGSVFSTKEWKQIQMYCYPDYDGKKAGELGGLNNWYEWDFGVWYWVGPLIR